MAKWTVEPVISSERREQGLCWFIFDDRNKGGYFCRTERAAGELAALLNFAEAARPALERIRFCQVECLLARWPQVAEPLAGAERKLDYEIHVRERIEKLEAQITTAYDRLSRLTNRLDKFNLR